MSEKTEVAKYETFSVYSDIPKVKAKKTISNDVFTKSANQAITQVREWWGVEPVGLLLEDEGVVALTRSGDRLLVRFDKKKS